MNDSADPGTRNPTVLLLVGLFVAATLSTLVYPLATAEPAEGQVLGRIVLADLRAGDSEELTFDVDDRYDRLGLSYNITTGAHLRASFIDPLGRQHDSTAAAGKLVLDASAPTEGTWTLRVVALDQPGLHGHLDRGEFVILGFGGPHAPPS